jgi:hypothetical protein
MVVMRPTILAALLLDKRREPLQRCGDGRYDVNDAAVAKARSLIAGRQYVPRGISG